MAVIEEWKGDVMEYMQDMGEAQGGIWGRLSEAEARANQLQVLLMSAHRELDLLLGVVVRQSEVINIQQELLLTMEVENQRKFKRIERMLDLRGRTFTNPIVIDLDLEDRGADGVTLVNQ